MKTKTIRLVIISAAFCLLASLVLVTVSVRMELNRPYYGGASEGVYLEVPRGSNARQIASLLVEHGILRWRIPFILHLRFHDRGRRIQAGEYYFCKPATPLEVAERLIRGDVYFRSITIPEGLTARETIELLAQNGMGNLREMEKLITKTDWIKDIDPQAKNLEGYLFPETYRFDRNAKSEVIIKTMVNQFRRSFFKILSESTRRPELSIPQIVTLASMIEKEAKLPQEAPIIASVLLNRLARNMPLACDATIIYAMKLAGTYEGRLGKSDLKMDSPYNSYLHADLPPGPIANPGPVSLRAALNPAETDFLYYVSRNDGTHQFSKDLRSHINAVNIFQKPLARRN